MDENRAESCRRDAETPIEREGGPLSKEMDVLSRDRSGCAPYGFRALFPASIGIEGERRYERSIQRLEMDARLQMADLDLELLFLYRDRLETIDEQIAQCKEALSSNSGNAHIRRYMLAAFQDKKDTLREIVRTSELKIQERSLE